MSASDELVCVDPARIPEIWPHVESLIKRAFYSGIGDDSPQDVHRELIEGSSLLWIVWGVERAIIAAATTKIITPSRGKLCLVTSCAGHEMLRWVAFLADLETYARQQGCIEMRIYGRPGWKRALPGYHEPWIALSKDLR